MQSAGDLRDELAALQSELAEVPAFTEDADAAPGADEVRSQVEQVLRELQAQLKDVADNAETLVAEHPLVSVASAFLLGVVVGRLLTRAR